MVLEVKSSGMNVATPNVTTCVELERMNQTMLDQFFTRIAQDKIWFLVNEKGGRLDYVDDQVATVVVGDNVAEVCLYGNVQWIS